MSSPSSPAKAECDHRQLLLVAYQRHSERQRQLNEANVARRAKEAAHTEASLLMEAYKHCTAIQEGVRSGVLPPAAATATAVSKIEDVTSPRSSSSSSSSSATSMSNNQPVRSVVHFGDKHVLNSPCVVTDLLSDTAISVRVTDPSIPQFSAYAVVTKVEAAESFLKGINIRLATASGTLSQRAGVSVSAILSPDGSIVFSEDIPIKDIEPYGMLPLDGMTLCHCHVLFQIHNHAWLPLSGL